MNTPSRVVKTKVPLRVSVTATLSGVTVVAFILLAIWQSGIGLHEARMSGVIVTKEFKPYPEPERQITLNRGGTVSAQTSTGQYLITVEVLQKGDSK